TVDGVLYSLEPASGTVRWKTKTGAAVIAPLIPVGDRLAVVTDDGKFRTFLIANGQEQWVLDLEEKVRAQPVVISESGVVYVTDLKFRVRALNALRGTMGWLAQLPSS
ncbi:MAG: PQQ-like beta-propeller repeat protein, partial [SAR202 cluster bacterium]|nr:PQQ-like beta-propeller repeat protein [SAR202 cluster bacterium]